MPTASRKSSRSTTIDDIDAITPCPLTRSTSGEMEISELVEPIEKFQQSRSPSPCSECSSAPSEASTSKRRQSLKVLEEGTNGDPERLWNRMLALQRAFGCYNSARMSAALSSGDFSLLLPSKACLNLLNENMTFMPDEAETTFDKGRSNRDSRRSP
ncbi:hypothetical protein GGR53DRAFT_260778 [Hypoxylon sp. FL1150]|nr:hypothetical protein GGR53DRAFT_260778 [Hypoxylon sp. FL1150]